MNLIYSKKPYIRFIDEQQTERSKHIMANRISASEFNIEIPKLLNRINEATGSPIRPYNAGCSVITAGHGG
jgi:hypothetical protein